MAETTKFDESVESESRLTVIRAIQHYRQESEQAREGRIRQNRRNRDLYLGRQDWSHKQEGQSTEFLPKVPVAVEQMSAFVKRGLVQFGDWFSVDVDRNLSQMVDGTQIRSLMKCFLSQLWEHNNQTTDITTVISDSVKNGLLESLMIVKVHGGMMKRRTFHAPGTRPDNEDEEPEREEDEEPPLASEMQEPRVEEDEEWRLRIDLVRPEDYYPDPTGNGLYEIHRVERDLHEVMELAEEGVYDKKAVEQLVDTDFPRPEDEKRTERDRNQQETVRPSFRKRVVLDEFWGTILNDDGTVAHRNVVATVANDKFLIRGPEPNPFWHQESPFVAAPLIRVPWSVWHKALYDHTVDLNLALNELFNLMLDGGISAVWGIKQVRLEELEDPGQVSGGIKQGDTLAVKQTLPHGENVLDTVSTGDVPQDAMAIFEFVNREFNQAALTNELSMGALPGKQVRATEVVESRQSQAALLDGIVSDIEVGFIQPMLRKAFMTILQNADEVPPEALRNAMDRRVARIIMNASAGERFALFAGQCSFKANGLSATTARAMDFQKTMALLQSVTTNPMLFQSFMKRFSPDSTLRTLMRQLNINPDDIEKSAQEIDEQEQEMQRTQQAAEMLGGGGQSEGGEGPTNGQLRGNMRGGLETAGQGDSEAASINQETNPRTGLVPNA